MADEGHQPEDRIDQLSQRFQRHSVERKVSAQRNRERHSFYLDGDLVSRVDRTYRDVNHGLHPRSVTKSVFLETLLEFALDHLPEVTTLVNAKAEA